MTKKPTFAIASDLSEVIQTDDGFGNFPTRLDALDRQIEMLEGERARLGGYLATAKRLRRKERKATTAA